ncbi:hypothetical protein [Mesorhizobium sp.]|uniref:hypothetical protein n=1 Tax=Mesorhizobium sp. TaxID=1871066 RepID=UPI0025B80E1E|nr:hypothetical protein [Mesorhizobium sp.]
MSIKVAWRLWVNGMHQEQDLNASPDSIRRYALNPAPELSLAENRCLRREVWSHGTHCRTALRRRLLEHNDRLPRAPGAGQRLRDEQACTAERPFALGDLQGQAPHIVGKCLTVDPALEDDYDRIAWNVRPDGTLVASLEVSGMLVASNSVRPEKDYLKQQ